MPTNTTNYSLQKPLVNSAIDQDLWGNELNDDLDDIDELLRTGITIATSAQTTGFTADVSISKKYLYLCDATGAAFAATLPTAAAAGVGATVYFKKTDATANAVTVTRASTDTIDGATTFALSAQYENIGLVSDGVSVWSSITFSKNSPAFTGTPTAPTAANSTNTTQIATTAFAYGSLTSAASGYQKLPSGLVMQWTKTGSISSGANATINLPLAITNLWSASALASTVAASAGVAITNFTGTTVLVTNTGPGTQDYYLLIIGV